jgi:hypothetical protein
MADARRPRNLRGLSVVGFLALLVGLVPPGVAPDLAAAASAPPPPVVTAPSRPVVVNAASHTVAGRATANALVRIYADANGNGRRDQTENTVAGSQQLARGATAFSIRVPLTGNAVNRFVATAALPLPSGVESGSTPVPAITEDSTRPVISAVADTPDPFSHNGDGVKDRSAISYTLSEPAGVLIRIFNAAGVRVRILVDVQRTAGPSSEVWDGKSGAGTLVPDGTYTYRIDAVDAALNGAVQQTGTVTVDTGAPTVVMTAPASAAATNDRRLAASAADGAGSGVEAVQFQVSADSGATWADPGAAVTAAPHTLTAAGLADGSYRVRAIATDRAGNRTTSAAVGLTLDTTPPDTSITSKPDNPSASTGARFTFVSSEPNSPLECRLDGGTFAWCISPTDYVGLAAGNHTFAVRARDGAGNTDQTPATFAWTINLGPPLPADPATVAPALDRSVATDVKSATEFLYTGANPIQTGVSPGTIELLRAAVLRGKVSSRDGQPIAGVKLTVLGHP